MVYYILSTLVLLLGLGSFNKKNKGGVAYLLAILAIIVIAGLKTDGSTDYLSYKGAYEDPAMQVELESSYEPGFQFFNIICKNLGFSFILYYFIFACISIGTKAYVFKKIAPYVFPALLMYLCGVFFERDNDGIRQGMSIAFCFLALYHLIRENKKGFVLCCLIAFLFHYSSIVFLVAFFFDRIKISDKLLCIIVFIFFVLCATHRSFSDLFMQYLPSGVAMAKMELYANSEEASASVGISVGLLFRLGILLLFMKSRKKMRIEERVYYILRNGFALSIIMSLAFNDFIILSHRLPYAFREFQIIIVSYLFTGIKNEKLKPILLILVWLYCNLLLYRYLNGDAAKIYNSYQNILF